MNTSVVNYKCLCALNPRRWVVPNFGNICEIAHFQKEWQTGAKMGARTIMDCLGRNCAR